MCIDVVAETLSSPKDVQLLALPSNIKEKIAKVVIDPDVDFCCVYRYNRDKDKYICNARSFDSTTIDRAACKSLMTALR